VRLFLYGSEYFARICVYDLNEHVAMSEYMPVGKGTQCQVRLWHASCGNKSSFQALAKCVPLVKVREALVISAPQERGFHCTCNILVGQFQTLE